MDQGVKTTLRSISTIIVILVAVVAFFISGIRLFGFQVYGVLSGSMEPSYPVGSLVYVKQIDPAELKIRDVITYSINRNTIVTHRIIEIVPDENNPNMVRYRTKGDANENADTALVSAGSIIGKVSFCIPHLGNIASYIQRPPGLYVAIGLGIVLIAIVIMTDSIADASGKEEQVTQKKTLLANIPGVSPLLMKLGLIKSQPESQQGQIPTQSANPPFATGGYPVQAGLQTQAQSYPYQGMQLHQSAEQFRQPQGYPQQQPIQRQLYPQQEMQLPQQAGRFQQPQGYPQQMPMQRQPYPQRRMQTSQAMGQFQQQGYPQQQPMRPQPYPSQGMQLPRQTDQFQQSQGSPQQQPMQRQPYPQQWGQPSVQPQPTQRKRMQSPPQAVQYQTQDTPSYATGSIQQPRRRTQRSQQGAEYPQ